MRYTLGSHTPEWLKNAQGTSLDNNFSVLDQCGRYLQDITVPCDDATIEHNCYCPIYTSITIICAEGWDESDSIRIVCERTHSKGHHEVDHALLVVALPATQTEPLVHHATFSEAFGDGDVGPCYPVVHGERPLDDASVKTQNITWKCTPWDIRVHADFDALRNQDSQLPAAPCDQTRLPTVHPHHTNPTDKLTFHWLVRWVECRESFWVSFLWAWLCVLTWPGGSLPLSFVIKETHFTIASCS